MKLPAYLRTKRARFAAFVLMSMAPLLVLWWLAAGLLTDALQPLAAALANVFQLTDGVTRTPGHDWVVNTGLTRASGTDAGAVLVSVPFDTLRRMLLGFPIFLALTAAPPRSRPLRGVLLGCLVLAVLFVFSTLSVILNDVSVIVNYRATLVADTVPPPPFTVTQPRMSETAFFLSAFVTYLALQGFPLIAPVVLWAALNVRGLALLMVGDVEDASSEVEVAGPVTT